MFKTFVPTQDIWELENTTFLYPVTVNIILFN